MDANDGVLASLRPHGRNFGRYDKEGSSLENFMGRKKGAF